MKKAFALLLSALTLLALTACNGGGAAPSSAATVPAPSLSAPQGDEISRLDPAVKAVLQDKTKVNISFWTGTGEANFPYMEAVVKSFQEAYPNISVDFSNQGPITELTDKLTQNIVSKTTPTLSNINPTSFPEYISSGAIVDLMDYYNHSEIGFSDAEKNVLYANYINEAISFGGEGTMFGFPTNKKTTDVFVYNKTYFDEKAWSAPDTWSKVAEYSKIIYEETGSAGFSYDTSAGDAAFKTMTKQWGSQYIADDGKIDLDNQATRDAIQFYKENMDAGYFTLPALMPSAGGNHSSNGFVMGECYMYVGPAAGVPYAVPSPDKGHKDFELAVAPLPQKDAANSVAFSKGEDYCVFTNSTDEEKVAAWLLIKHLSGDEQNVEWLVNTGNLPVSASMLDVVAYRDFLSKEADNTPAYYKAAAVNAALSMQSFMSFDKIIPQTSALVSEVTVLWQAVMIGGADVDVAIADAIAKIG